MKRGLGKGLDALFADNSVETDGGGAVSVRISEIEPNKGQPRKHFDPEALSQLADSIRQHGVLQPLLVRPLPGSGNYQLVAGERRWRAARMAGLTEVPVTIRELTDYETMEIALIENLQREDLNPVEEARGYQQLMESYNMTQEEIAKRVGKSRPAVANSLRLLGLPEVVLRMLEEGSLSQGHARALLSIGDGQQLQKAAEEAATQGLSVREVEKLARRLAEPAAAKAPAKTETGLLAGEVERGLTEYLGHKVKVVQGARHGVLQIEFYGEEDLRNLSLMISENS